MGKGRPIARSLKLSLSGLSSKIRKFMTFSDLIIDDVYASTNQFQHPDIAEDELRGEVILSPAETAEEVWARIRKSNDPSTFRQFIKDFPDSPLADAAQAVLDKLDLEGRLRDTEKARREDRTEGRCGCGRKSGARATRRANEGG